MEGSKQRETASKCFHIYNVEANSRIHVYTDRLWTEALRTASVQGAERGSSFMSAVRSVGRAQLITCAQLTHHIHTGHPMCRPHHACSLLTAVQTSSHMHTLIIYTQLFVRASRHRMQAHHVQRLRHMQRSHAKPGPGAGLAGH